MKTLILALALLTAGSAFAHDLEIRDIQSGEIKVVVRDCNRPVPGSGGWCR